MKAADWVELIIRAVGEVIREAREAGNEPPGAKELEIIAGAADDAVRLALQGEILGIAMLVQVAAASAIAEIDSLSKDPMCPQCGKPLRQFIQVSPGVPNPPNAPRPMKCDDCGWSTP